MALTKEDLMAISQVLDSRLDDKLTPIYSQLESIDGRLDNVEDRLTHVEERLDNVEGTLTHVQDRLDNVEVTLTHVQDRLDHVEGRLDHVEDSLTHVGERLDCVEGRLTKIELIQENDMLPRLQNIESCYLSTFDRYQEHVSGYKTMESDIELLKKVVAAHF